MNPDRDFLREKGVGQRVGRGKRLGEGHEGIEKFRKKKEEI